MDPYSATQRWYDILTVVVVGSHAIEVMCTLSQRLFTCCTVRSMGWAVYADLRIL